MTKRHAKKMMKRGIRAWLRRADGAVEGDVTFAECWRRMRAGEEFREVVGAEAAQQRRRVFAELARGLGKSYAAVEGTWLDGKPTTPKNLVRAVRATSGL